MLAETYRGRLAPSPTGYLHLGHARTFWIAQQRARAAGGVLIFRNDDLDQQRSRPEYVAAMYEDMHWLGLEWQEGPYAQSERREVYLAAWRKLRDADAIYPCTCSRKDLAQAVGAPHDDADEVAYPGTCRGKFRAEEWATPSRRRHERQHDAAATAGETPAQIEVSWRFRLPEGEQI